MKNWLKRNAGYLLTTCLLGWNFVYHIDSFSLYMFGEPELPTED